MSGEQHQHVVGTEGRPPPATVTTSTCTTSTPIDSSTGSPKPSPPPSPKRSPRAPKEDLFYWVKKTSFLQRDVSYICQNINGPCPLLAICNVLLLRGHVSIDEHLHVMGPSNFIFARDVVSIVENRLVHSNPHLNEAERVMLTEVVALVQTLQVGLDVNVQFHDIGAFEYTNACAIFDLLDMRLVHGWVVDPQDTAAYSLLAHKSYNQIVDRLIDYHSIESKAQSIPILMKERSLSMDDAALKVDQITSEGPVIDAFLADSASQLTYVGLIQLHEDLKERELAVFFRNNHFSTIFKYDGALYLLVTDTGYYDEPHVIWEKLEHIDGNSEYYTKSFVPLVGAHTKQQELLRLKTPPPLSPRSTASLPPPVPSNSPLASTANTLADDFALALKLQQEEDNAAADTRQATGTSTPSRNTSPKHAPNATQRTSPREASSSNTSPRSTAAVPQPVQTTTEDDSSLLNLTDEELAMQMEAERFFNEQRLRNLPGNAAATQQQAGRRRQGSSTTGGDKCTLM